MTTSAIAEISRRQLADYDAHRPGRIFEDPSFRLNLDEAYAVQIQTAALRTARGESIGGYKIGCLSEPIQQQLNVDRPVFGHLFDSEFFRSGAVLDPSQFDCLAIEGELAVRVAEDIPDASRLPTDPTRLIGSAFVVIELHNHVFRAPTRTAQELIANNTFHAGVILPSLEFPLCDTQEPLSDPISVFRNGKLLGMAAGNSTPGVPLESVLSIIRHTILFGGGVRRGQILLTGSALPLYPVHPGDNILVYSPHSGQVSATISLAPGVLCDPEAGVLL
jgi:2-keto-4-pentenoate hydratase